jgi:hypothetical protein
MSNSGNSRLPLRVPPPPRGSTSSRPFNDGEESKETTETKSSRYIPPPPPMGAQPPIHRRSSVPYRNLRPTLSMTSVLERQLPPPSLPPINRAAQRPIPPTEPRPSLPNTSTDTISATTSISRSRYSVAII